MSLVYCDGFDDYSVISSHWHAVSNSIFSTPVEIVQHGRWGGRCIAFHDTWQSVRRTVSANLPITVGFAVNPTGGTMGFGLYAESAGSMNLVAFYSGDTCLGYVNVFPTMYLGLWSGGYPPPPMTCTGGCPNAMELLAISTKPLRAGVYQYVEIMFGLGSFTVLINEETVADVLADTERLWAHIHNYNPNTEPPVYAHDEPMGAAAVQIGPNQGGVRGGLHPVYFDDLYIVDEGAYPTGFLGDIRVHTLNPVADGYYKQWNSTGGTVHYTEIDDPWNAVSMADKVAAQAEGKTDTYDLEDLPEPQTLIHTVVLNWYADMHTDPEQYVVAFLRRDGEDWESLFPVEFSVLPFIFQTEVPVDMFEEGPSGYDFWTVDAVNATEFGQKLVGAPAST